MTYLGDFVDVENQAGSDYVLDETAVVTADVDAGTQTLTVRSPAFFASMDPSNGPAAGFNYCKALSYTRAWLLLREMAAKTP